MTYRKYPIFPEQIYHVFNRSIAQQPIFFESKDYQRFLDTINFYRYASPPLRFSFYNRLTDQEKTAFMENLQKEGTKQIAIFTFCLMPNHFHFLLKELIEGGIRKFASNLQNSYAKYCNTKSKRTGGLFQEMFKAVRIETDEQFIHVARYIHLNPYSSFIVKDLNQLQSYPWCSLRDYLEENRFDFLDKEFLISFFKSKNHFKNFTFDQADYQRHLEEIKHIAKE
jgi:putative transposase